MDCLFLIFLLIISIYIFQTTNVTEGYTNCIKKPPIQLYSFHYQQQWNELSILPNIDLANRANRVNIPLETIRKHIHKDKDKLILLIMNKESRLFKPSQKKQPKPSTPPKQTPKQTKPRFINGYEQSQLPYSDF